MKVVSQLNAQGYLVGGAIADESPLEPGVFLLPGGCVEVEPIEVPAGKVARFDGAAFVLEDAPAPADSEALPEKTPEQSIEEKKQAVRAVREVVLGRLLCIKDAARDDNDLPLVEACRVARRGLLDITKDLPPDPQLAELTMVTRYMQIRMAAVAVSPSLELAFAQIDA